LKDDLLFKLFVDVLATTAGFFGICAGVAAIYSFLVLQCIPTKSYSHFKVFTIGLILDVMITFD